MKARSMTSIRRRLRLQECSHGAVGPQIWSCKIAFEEYFCAASVPSKTRRNALLKDWRANGGRSPEFSGLSEMHFCAILVASTQKRSKMRFCSSRSAVPRLRGCIPQVCCSSHFLSQALGLLQRARSLKCSTNLDGAKWETAEALSSLLRNEPWIKPLVLEPLKASLIQRATLQVLARRPRQGRNDSTPPAPQFQCWSTAKRQLQRQ